MISCTSDWKEWLNSGDYTVMITLNNQTLTNLDIPFSDVVQNSLVVNRFSVTGGQIEVGSATAAEVQITLDNSVAKAREAANEIGYNYDDVVFEGARVSFAFKHVSVENNVEVPYTLYFIIATVDEVTRQGDYIHLVLLDDMVKLDKPVSGTIPTSVSSLISAICTAGGFTYASTESNLVNSSVTLAAPTSENLTYRQLLQWVCQVTGTCAYIGVISGAAKLVLDWYGKTYQTVPSGATFDETETYYTESSGVYTEADISAFASGTTYYYVDRLKPSNRFSSTIDQQPITITGVSVKVGDTAYESKTNANYVLSIENNELIDATNAQTIATGLASRLNGFSYTPFSAETNGLTWLQPLDMVVFTDKGGTDHDVIITDWTFSPYANVKLEGKGESQTRKGYATNAPFTAEQTKIIEEIKRNQPEVNVDSRMIATLSLNEAINNGGMLHDTTVDGVKYYHDAETLAASTYIIKATTNGIGWTTQGWNNGSPTFEYGITGDGTAILNQLHSYSINADLITAGTIDADLIDVDNLTAKNLEIKSGNTTVHKLSDTDKSVMLGGANGISYSTSGTNANKIVLGSDVIISGSVTIGGLDDAAASAVADALNDVETEYAISTSSSTPPQPLETPSAKWYYASPSVMQESDIVTAFSAESSWTQSSQYYNGLAYRIKNTGWSSTDKYLYSFVRTEGENGTWNISEPTEEAVFESGDSSTLLESIVCWNRYSQAKTNQAIVTEFTSGTMYYWAIGLDSTYRYMYSGERKTYADGSVVVSNIQEYTAIGSSGNEIDRQIFWLSDTSSDVSASRCSYINDNWLNTNIVGNSRRSTYGEYGFFIGLGKWNSSNPYLKIVTRSAYADGSTAITDMKVVAVYGESYPPFGTSVWSSTMPSISDNKGKYLWTRVSYDSGETWNYTVNYIGADGTPGQDGTDGKGIASTTIEYASSSSNTTTPTSGWQSTVPSVSQGNYLWTRTTITYSDNTTSASYSVARQGANGSAGKGISTITQYYYATEHDNDTLPQKGTNSWKQLPSDTSFSQGVPYLWSYTETTYTVGNATTTTPDIVGYWGQDGDSGSAVTGRGISSIKTQYALSTSNSTAPAEDSQDWQDTPAEYPSNPIRRGTTTQNSTDQAWITGLNLTSGTTYTVKYSFDYVNSSDNPVTVYVKIKNGSNTSLTSKTVSSTDTGSFTYTPQSDQSSCYLTINPSGAAVPFVVEVIMPTNSVRYYYWQRDEIEWTSAPLLTHTTAVLSTGYNKAIFEINRLNPCFAEVMLDGFPQVVMDAGKLYCDSVTAYSITAYQALIKNLMANYVRVDGDVDVVGGTIKITQSPASITEDDMSQTYLDTFCQQRYNKTYAQLSPFIQPYAFMLAVSSYLATVAQSAANAGKLVVQNNNNATIKSALYPNLLLFYNSNDTEYSYYGSDASVAGNMKIGGDLTAGNIRKGAETFNVDTNGDATIIVSFDPVFNEPPVVSISVMCYEPCMIATLGAYTSSGFTAYIKKTSSSQYNNGVLNWIAIS